MRKRQHAQQTELPNGRATPVVRCAIYTRKSTEEGLEQEFNSLDAQREAAESYIASQRHAGWVLVSERYDDGGYSGGTLERPAMQRLLADLQADKLDCVVVYKVDRASRSILDFARLMHTFQHHGISFVSVTQQFNTATSMGNLVLNILLSFAQFEREMIAERTRDKMSAARRKGKWVGGIPVLGYDVDQRGGRLRINEEEGRVVRALFQLYLEYGSLVAVVREANRRGWMTKDWTTRAGRCRRGRLFTKNALHRLLTNIIYTGRIQHQGQVYEGEHEAIIAAELWEKVNQKLCGNASVGSHELRNKYGALLRGLLHCAACGTAMVHTYVRKNERRYRYYVCQGAQQRGWDSCPSKSLNAARIEGEVLGRVRGLGADTRIVREVMRQARRLLEESVAELNETLKATERQLRVVARRAETTRQGGADTQRTQEAMALQEEKSRLEARVEEIRRELDAAQGRDVDHQDVRAALGSFEGVWEALGVEEQIQLLRAVVERIDYDGRHGRIAMRYRSVDLKAACESV